MDRTRNRKVEGALQKQEALPRWPTGSSLANPTEALQPNQINCPRMKRFSLTGRREAVCAATAKGGSASDFRPSKATRDFTTKRFTHSAPGSASRLKVNKTEAPRPAGLLTAELDSAGRGKGKPKAVPGEALPSQKGGNGGSALSPAKTFSAPARPRGIFL